MTTVRCSVIAWDLRNILPGTLRAPDLEVCTFAGRIAVEDIRNCSIARDATWGAVTAVNRETGRHGLWRLDLAEGQASLVWEGDYVLGNAIDPSGRYVCFVAPPWTTRGDASLHVHDVQSAGTTRIVHGSVARACIPSWRASSQVVYHTEDRQVMAADVGTRQVELLLRGEFPSVSPDGLRIAYREGDRIRIASGHGPASEVTPRRGFWEGGPHGSMSWSADGRRLLVGRLGGLLRRELVFYVLDVATRARIKVRQRNLHGIRFA